jgi:hypothetical protein
MRIPVGGGIDDNLDALVFGVISGVAAVLRAKIDAGGGGEAALFERCELGRIIGREEDVVMREVEARGLDVSKEGDSGKRAVLGIERGHGPANAASEFSGRQCRRIGVDDDAVGAELFARGKRDATLLDAGDGRIIPKSDAISRSEHLERAGERGKATVDKPHAFGLDMRDQHECRRRFERRGAAIGRVATEQLAQAWVGEKAAKDFPHIFHGANRDHVTDVGQPHPRHQAQRRGATGAHECRVEGIVRALCRLAKAHVALCRIRAGEARDRILACGRVGKKVERRGVRPCVARNDVGATQRDVVGQ